MPVVGTKAAASSQGFGEFTTVSGPATYIEDVFSTYLYSGTGANQTFNNGIDLSTKGGMVWIKQRSSPAEDWRCVDSARGITNGLQQNLTNAQQDWTGLGYVTSFNTNGFSIGTNVSINTSAYTYASWTFRKQPKFFDVVTWTGDGATNRNIPHALGSAPGCVIVKGTNQATNWFVWHRSGTQTNESAARLNTTAAYAAGGNTYWGSPTSGTPSMTSTTFSVGDALNVSTYTYVAYVFAHNAGGFGLTGTDNVISCGSFTTDASGNATVTLGYEPQWVMVKGANVGSNWITFDNMRGFGVTQNSQLYPNTSDAEVSSSSLRTVTATGVQFANFYAGSPSSTFIYIAIRRGPMKTPTTGTSVFEPLTHSGTSAARSIATSFPFDFLMVGVRSAASARFTNTSRLTANGLMWTGTANAESSNTSVFPTNVATSTQNAFTLGDDAGSDWVNASGNTYVDYNLRRAPGFFDVVCYTGNGVSGLNVNHNLGVVPEMMIVKSRTVGSSWYVYTPTTGNTNTLELNTTAASAVRNVWGNTTPTSSVFTVGQSGAGTNNSAATYVAYLFASCPGVSKVGSYTGTGATQTISCGFAARFVLIKRTDSTGNWWVWDTARGMVAGTDPRLPMNTTTIEANANWVYTDAAGFQIVTTDATVNASGGSYIYLCIA